MNKDKIEISVAGKDIAFEMNTPAYNDYINALLPDNKVAPAHNLLMKTVVAEDKDKLSKILEKPGAAIQIAAAVTSDFAPALELAVKKPKGTVTD